MNSSKKNQYNENCMPHGYWEDYHSNGQLKYRGYYNNGDFVGFWESFGFYGEKVWSSNYLNDKRIGYYEEYENGILNCVEYVIR